MVLNPLTLKKIQRFRSIKRGYYSAIILVALMFLCCAAELLINKRALVVHYEGQWFFPTYGNLLPGSTFGLDYDYETNYRQLQKKFELENSNNFLIMPLVPYGPYDTDLNDTSFPPFPPSVESQHYLGTDIVGRDIVARLVYGFRVSIVFSLSILVITYSIGIFIGSLMGYWGGLFDLIFQRIIEIWSSIPFLYAIMIVAALVVPNLWILIGIYVFFRWMEMTWYLRTLVYREKARDYVMAAKAIGATDFRIIIQHILPNTISLIVTFVPFTIASGISGLTALDYLGFGLPAPTPSWGELLQQGVDNLDALWIVSSIVGALVLVMICITFVGEAVREAFDPKQYTIYE